MSDLLWPIHEQMDHILENLLYVGIGGEGALVALDASPEFVRDIEGAAISRRLGIGFAYARSRYVPEFTGAELPALYESFQEVYFAGRRHMDATAGRFRTGVEPTAGAVYSKAALDRLPATYFSAGLLFRTGRLFEAQALCRVFLEQVAWAYAVHGVDSYSEGERVSVTMSISELKRILPAVGQLYGTLSRDTHLGIESHLRFLDFDICDSGAVILAHGNASLSAGAVLLELSDAWSVVYELSQSPWMGELENWSIVGGVHILRENRPFLGAARSLKSVMDSDI